MFFLICKVMTIFGPHSLQRPVGGLRVKFWLMLRECEFWIMSTRILTKETLGHVSVWWLSKGSLAERSVTSQLCETSHTQTQNSRCTQTDTLTKMRSHRQKHKHTLAERNKDSCGAPEMRGAKGCQNRREWQQKGRERKQQKWSWHETQVCAVVE